MDTNELKKIGAQTLIISLKVCEDSLKNGATYGAKLDFHSAIREFTTVIDLFPQLVQLMENLNLPAGTKEKVALNISDIACKAYFGRSVSYMQIGEKGKGNADKIMSDKIIAILPSQGENPKLNNLNLTQHAETVDFQRTQFTNSSNDMASNDFEYTRIGSGIEIKKYIGSATSVNIPSKIDDLPVVSIGEKAFYQCRSLKSIQIPNSVTSIDEWAFWGCKSLISVRLLNPNTIIGKNAFKDCNRALRILRGADTSAEINKEIPQNTSSSYNTSVKKDDDNFLSKFLFWTAIVIFIIAALIAYFTGISFGNSLLITVVGIVGLIIWGGRR